jgi:hypothetical protein
MKSISSNKSALIGLSFIILVISFGVPTMLGLLSSSTTIGSSGSIKAIGVGVYWDTSCTSLALSINWGVIEPGYSENVTLYVKNTGNADLNLSLVAANWNPSTAMDFLSLEWNYDGTALGKDEVVQVILTLSVDSETTGIDNFSLDIIISGSG